MHVNGSVEDEVTDVRDVWRDDLVAFLIGCSFTFERALLAARVAGPAHRAGRERADVPDRGRVPAGGAVLRAARRLDAADDAEQAIRATQITSRYPSVHGAPVHVGDPSALGIASLAAPQYGDPVEIRDGEVPVFWACGVTPQAVAAASRPELMITHAPGHMFVTDVPDERLAER